MLRAAIVGLGYWGPNLVRNLLASRSWELVAVVDRDPSRLSAPQMRLAKRHVTDMTAILADVDAVIIATPPETHGSLVRQALEAGKHVLVEKPLTTDREDA